MWTWHCSTRLKFQSVKISLKDNRDKTLNPVGKPYSNSNNFSQNPRHELAKPMVIIKDKKIILNRWCETLNSKKTGNSKKKKTNKDILTRRHLHQQEIFDAARKAEILKFPKKTLQWKSSIDSRKKGNKRDKALNRVGKSYSNPNNVSRTLEMNTPNKPVVKPSFLITKKIILNP